MKVYLTGMLSCLMILFALPAFAEELVEPPASCQQCGMDRTVFSQSRVVVTYADGTTEGACSIHCAVTQMQHKGKDKVASVKVADYASRRLIDATSATWVVGGSRSGVMTALPKWAFAREEDARQFISENGGKIAPYDEVVRLASEEIARDEAGEGGSHRHGHGHSHGGGGGVDLLANPAIGEDIYHVHPAGMWMANYKFMHTSQRGLRSGTTNVSVERVIPMASPYGYMMAPTEMTMDMHMVMLMYGVTDRLTLMGMGTYMDNRMEMLMNMGMGMGNRPEPPMRTSGAGDTELRAIYRLWGDIVGSLGVSIPTGGINEDFTTMGMKFRTPYDMQLGSGTVDLKPALTYNALSADGQWNWGGQASYLWHIDRNKNHYTLGDVVRVTTWGQRALGPLAGWLRFSYSDTGRISGRDPEIQKLLDPVMGAPTPDADPANYGGDRIDGFVGVSLSLGMVSLGVEGGLPLYQHVNGLQLKNDWYINAGIQVMF